VSYNADTKVSEILKEKLGRIKRAPLDPGSPSWDEISALTWQEIEVRARQNMPGYSTIRKLLTDSRFNK
jgi:hypothetical protein